MPRNEKAFVGYNDGYEMWRDNVMSYGFDEAVIISRNYLDMNLKHRHSDEEKQFCRELFTAMLEATASKIYPKKLIYPYDFETADKRTEASYYHLNYKLNMDCACGIDSIINSSCYETNFYNLELAAMRAIMDYGFHRVCLVLAFNYQHKGNDGRLSAKNRQWADTFTVQEKSFDNTWLQAHATLIDGFCGYVRELYQNLAAEYLILPGNEESGEFAGDVRIKRALITSDDGKGFLTGYAIGYNPDAVQPWVCWQFAVRDGVRHYNWGVYADDEQTVVDSYIARIFVALN